MNDNRRAHYLNAIGLDAWSLRATPDSAAASESASDVAVSESTSADPVTAQPVLTDQVAAQQVAPTARANLAVTLEDIAARVRVCQACELHSHRQNTVFGAGKPGVNWMFIGEAPGAQEDRQGEPFVGRAGQLLNAMLQAMRMSRDEVYIANVLKCRPPGNRDPMGEEVRRCEPFLLEQIEQVKPKIIVAMGRFAAQSLLRSTEAIGRLRGRAHQYEANGLPLIVTYHPAYLLRNPIDKRKVWDDLLLAQKTLSGLPA